MAGFLDDRHMMRSPSTALLDYLMCPQHVKLLLKYLLQLLLCLVFRHRLKARASCRLSVCADHCLPAEVQIPRLFRSRARLRIGSPARTRRTHSLITAASDSRTVTRSRSNPNGRGAPPQTFPAWATSNAFLRIRSALCSLSYRAQAPSVRATARPAGVEKSTGPALTVSTATPAPSQTSMNSSSSRRAV
jgi:hypothetical protein